MVGGRGATVALVVLLCVAVCWVPCAEALRRGRRERSVRLSAQVEEAVPPPPGSEEPDPMDAAETVEFTDDVQVQWEAKQTVGMVPGRREDFSATLVGKYIYVFGGCSEPDNTCFNDIEVFNTETNAWFKETTSGVPPSPRQGHCAVYVNVDDRPQLLLFGGYYNNEYNNEVFVYEVESLFWRKPVIHGDKLPAPREGHACALLGKHVYVFGGYSDEAIYNDVWAFDLDTFQWKEVAAGGVVPPAREGMSVTVVGKRMFFIGGYSEGVCTNDVYILEAKQGKLTWANPTTTGNAKEPSEDHACSLVEDKIYCWGGCEYPARKCYKSLRVLDPVTYEWSDVQVTGPVPNSREGFGAVVLGSRIWIAMGCLMDIECYNDVFILNTQPCSNGCSGHGACEFGECKCEDGFSGADCSVAEDDEAAEPSAVPVTNPFNGAPVEPSPAPSAPALSAPAVPSPVPEPEQGGEEEEGEGEGGKEGEEGEEKQEEPQSGGTGNETAPVISSEPVSDNTTSSNATAEKEEDKDDDDDDDDDDGDSLWGKTKGLFGKKKEKEKEKEKEEKENDGKCSDKCKEHGHCEKDGICVCKEGWRGTDCSKAVTPDAGKGCPKECSGHGECDEGECSCDFGWRGKDCSKKWISKPSLKLPWGDDTNYTGCPNECSGHGDCEKKGVCDCDRKWYGPDCSRNDTGTITVRITANVSSSQVDKQAWQIRVADVLEVDASRIQVKEVTPSGSSAQITLILLEANKTEDEGEEDKWSLSHLKGKLSWGKKSPRDLAKRLVRNVHSGRVAEELQVPITDLAEMTQSTGKFSVVAMTCPLDCNGHGDCEMGECDCDTGYKGDDCSQGIRSKIKKLPDWAIGVISGVGGLIVLIVLIVLVWKFVKKPKDLDDGRGRGKARGDKERLRGDRRRPRRSRV